MTDSQKPSSAQDWDKFWQGAGGADAYSDSGVNHPAISSWWAAHLQDVASGTDAIRILDVATGNGAVIDIAMESMDGKIEKVSCVDISQAAIDNVSQRYPDVAGIVADARSIPLDDSSFELVVSQFGVEYAGVDAIFEAARLVAESGQISLLIHAEGSLIHKESTRNRDAVQQVIDCDFVPLAKRFFEAGFAAVRGADRKPYDDAGADFQKSVVVVDSVLDGFGDDIAGGTILHLYEDIGRIHTKLPNYDPEEVLNWLESMKGELDSYVGRMNSMLDAAVDEQTLRSTTSTLESGGFEIEVADLLYPESGPGSLGWIIVARRVR